MVAHFLTKPLQEELFQTFRDAIMGVRHVSTLDELFGSPRKEHVERIGSIESRKVLEEQNNPDEIVTRE